MNKKSVYVVAVFLVLTAAALGFFWPFGEGSDTLRFSGTVEIQEVKLGSKVKGRVKEVATEEGREVTAGQPLVYIEVPDLEAQRDQWKAQVRATQAETQIALARLWRTLTGFRPEEIAQAESELAAAEGLKVQTEKELKRVATLLPQKGASQAEFDAATGAYVTAAGRFGAAFHRFEMLKYGSREEDKLEAFAEWKRASAKHEEAQAKLREAEVYVKEGVVSVPEKLGRAMVTVLPVRPGDLVEPGQTLVRVLRTEEMWVRFYVPETQLGKVRLHQKADLTIHQKVDVTIDAYPDHRFTGTIYEINPIAEFLPRNVQSKEERRHQVFGVKVKIDNSKHIFNAGMAAEVIIKAAQP